MNKKLLIGINVVIIGLVIAAAIIRPLFIWWIFWFTLIGAWICLVWMVRKKKTKIFHDQMEPKLAERRLKWLKTFLLVAGISFAMFIVGVILHNVLYALLDKEEPVSFFIGLLGGLMLFIANIGSLVIFLKGRRKQAKGIPK